MKPTHEASCLCGAVKLALFGDPKLASHCHCGMCRKAHGAAFATYVGIEKSKFQIVSGEDKIASYNSSGTIVRKFCSVCGSNIEWGGDPRFEDWVSIPLGLFDTPFVPETIGEIHVESCVPWAKLPG